MRSMTRVVALAGALSLLSVSVLGGCETAPRAGTDETVAMAAKPVNTMCPVGHEPITDAGGTSAYKGDTVGFCCAGCREFWEGMSDAERDEFVALAKQGRDDEFGR